MERSSKKRRVSIINVFLVMVAWHMATPSQAELSSIFDRRGCFDEIERAASALRQSIQHLGVVAQRVEPYGQAVIKARQALRMAGAFQYQVSNTCNPERVVMLRERLRDALDGVRQAFRASPVLPRNPQAFNAFKALVEDWETVRDLVSDIDNGEGPGGCYPIVMQSLAQLEQGVSRLAQVAARFEDRGQTEFTSKVAAYTIEQILRQTAHSCNKNQVLQGREEVRNRLDGVRQAFRASPILPSRPQAFEAFKQMVNAWEQYRDEVSNIP